MIFMLASWRRGAGPSLRGLITLILVGTSLLGQSANTIATKRLRILSYNIHHGAGRDGRIDLPRIARVIKRARPHLVSLQEVDRGVKRSKGVDQAERLAKLCAMKAVFGKAIPYQGGDYGNAVLSRLKIIRSKNHLLPKKERGEQRAALEVIVRLGGKETNELSFFATHFSWNPQGLDRKAAVARINELLAPKPARLAILAGDLNCKTDSPTIALLDASWKRSPKETPTYPGRAPKRQIDYVFSRPAACWKLVEQRVIDDRGASDHRPVLAVLERKTPSTKADEKR